MRKFLTGDAFTTAIPLADADRAVGVRGGRKLAAQSRARLKGELRINAPYSFGVHSLAPALPAYMADNPEVTVRLWLTDRVVDLVDEGMNGSSATAALVTACQVAKKLKYVVFPHDRPHLRVSGIVRG